MIQQRRLRVQNQGSSPNLEAREEYLVRGARRLLPRKQTLSHRSENVVQVVANRPKLGTEGEQKGEKQLAAFCGNLPLFSGLRRLRQDLVSLTSRLEGRRSIQLSYGRYIDSKRFPVSTTILKCPSTVIL